MVDSQFYLHYLCLQTNVHLFFVCFFSPVTSNEHHFNYKSLLNIQSHKITPNYVSRTYRMVTERKGTICSPHPCFAKQEAMGLHCSKEE